MSKEEFVKVVLLVVGEDGMYDEVEDFHKVDIHIPRDTKWLPIKIYKHKDVREQHYMAIEEKDLATFATGVYTFYNSVDGYEVFMFTTRDEFSKVTMNVLIEKEKK